MFDAQFYTQIFNFRQLYSVYLLTWFSAHWHEQIYTNQGANLGWRENNYIFCFKTLRNGAQSSLGVDCWVKIQEYICFFPFY